MKRFLYLILVLTAAANVGAMESQDGGRSPADCTALLDLASTGRSSEERGFAISALAGCPRSDRARDVIEKALLQDDRTIRERALDALPAHMSRASLPVVARLLDKNLDLRTRARLLELAHAHVEPADKTTFLVHFREGSLSHDPGMTAYSLLGLGRLQSDEDRARIRSFLKDKRPVVLQAALESLATLKDKASLRPAVLFLRNTDPRIQASAIRCVHAAGTSEADDALAALALSGVHEVNRPLLHDLRRNAERETAVTIQSARIYTAAGDMSDIAAVLPADTIVYIDEAGPQRTRDEQGESSWVHIRSGSEIAGWVRSSQLRFYTADRTPASQPAGKPGKNDNGKKEADGEDIRDAKIPVRETKQEKRTLTPVEERKEKELRKEKRSIEETKKPEEIRKTEERKKTEERRKPEEIRKPEEKRKTEKTSENSKEGRTGKGGREKRLFTPLSGNDYNEVARYFAGMDVTAEGPLGGIPARAESMAHRKIMDVMFERFEQVYLSKMRDWARTEIGDPGTPVLFYPFGGPELIISQTFFPNVKEYILYGLEPGGRPPNPTAVTAQRLPVVLNNIRNSLDSLTKVTYFQTLQMDVHFRATEITGAVPLMMVFLARTGNKITDVTEVWLAPDGKLYDVDDEAKTNRPSENRIVRANIKGDGVSGIRIRFEKNGVAKTATYFSIDISDPAIAKRPYFLQWVRSRGQRSVYLKAASYLLHFGNFTTIRSFLTDESRFILSDDTGIPLRFYDRKIWDLTFYGNYQMPIPLFSGMVQQDLRTAYADKKNVKPLPFEIGYTANWRPGIAPLIKATRRD